jgi:hypothetical protein
MQSLASTCLLFVEELMMSVNSVNGRSLTQDWGLLCQADSGLPGPGQQPCCCWRVWLVWSYFGFNHLKFLSFTLYELAGCPFYFNVLEPVRHVQGCAPANTIVSVVCALAAAKMKLTEAAVHASEVSDCGP